MSTTTFATLGVPTFICDALERRGITTPFAIQAATVADGLAGRDVLGRAPTGSGKTLAFGVPLIANTSELGRCAPGRPAGLVLAPTRELADQITAELRSFSGRLRVDVAYGGVGYGAQLTALRRGVDVLVACPGRLEDLIQRGDVDLGDVVHVVLDEADRMADMGFMPAVRRLLDRTSPERQTLLFSATLDGDVAKLVRDYQHDPIRHEVGEETPDVKAATHKFWTVSRTERNPVVVEVVNAAWPSIIFTRTRHGADRLAKQLGKLGLEAAPIHGGRSQSQRNRALEDFTKGRVHALVATDVAARGIHVDGVASVIHYDPPEDHTAYVHRSGRTARAGADGLVVSLVQPDQERDVRKMQRQIGLDEPLTAPVSGELHTAVPTGALAGDRELAPAVVRPASEDRPQQRRDQRDGGRRNGQRRRRPQSERRDGDLAQQPRERASSDGRDGRDGAGSDRSGRSKSGSGRRSGQGERGLDRSTDRRPAGSTANRQSSAGSSKQTNQSAASKGSGNRKARRAHLQPGR